MYIWSVFQVMGVFSKEYIPQGTRFGPLQGVIYTKDNVPKQANRKYFWRVRETHIHMHVSTQIYNMNNSFARTDQSHS